MNDEAHYILPDQLCIGLYIHLDLGWMDHPFPFSNFKIHSQEQIDKLLALKLGQIRYDPQRSDCAPLTVPEEADSVAAMVEPLPQPEPVPLNRRSERLMELHRMAERSEKDYARDAYVTRDILREFSYKPVEARTAAENLVARLVNSAMTEKDVVLHAIGSRHGKAENYVHALNVTVLALMMAKTLDMTESDARDLGLAALFHDAGKNKTMHHQVYRDQHCEQGAQLALDAGMSQKVARIILQHHEYIDGSGHPQRLMRDQIDPLARILALINFYDNLCNPLNPANAMTPYEALAHLYTVEFHKFEPDHLKLFIKLLGIYPPGSAVQLSDDTYGLVMTVNPAKPLLPLVMLHLPKVAPETPVILDLSEQQNLRITKCLRPAQLPQEVYDYLRPSKRVCYYFLNQAHTVQAATPREQENLQQRETAAFKKP